MNKYSISVHMLPLKLLLYESDGKTSIAFELPYTVFPQYRLPTDHL